MIDTPTPRPQRWLTRRVPRSRVHGYRRHCLADQVRPKGIYLRDKVRLSRIDLDDIATAIDPIAHDASAAVPLGIVRQTTVVESPDIPTDPR